MEYQYHEIANWFPMMDDFDLQKLSEDIKANSQQVPIELYDGRILDGRNRYEACRMAQVEPVVKDVTPADPAAYVLSRNLHRRHLTESQRAMIGDKARDYYEAEAKERMKSGGGDQTGAGVDTLPHPVKGKARDKAGAAVKVSGRTMDRAKKVREQGAKVLVKAVESGKIDVTNAAKIAELPKETQETLLDDAERNDWSARQVVEEAKRLTPTRVAVRMSNGLQYAKMAIAQLEKIDKHDTQRQEALELVAAWIEEHS